MLFGYLTLFTALIISVSSAVYSILGLTAIFAAAFWPIVILGGSLEVGKIVTTLWLHKYWKQAELQYKIYLCSAVAVLMLLTSMGVFGFLSKAHSDQALVSGDVQSKILIYDEKIKTAKENIDSDRKQLKQMDEAVDQVMSRSQDEKGADKSNAIRKSQARDRASLTKDIEANQKIISQLNDEAAPIRAEVRKVEADVGPIKYIAALIYGDNLDENVLEKAVRWVIILIVSVFDPLALTLLLAATKTFEWEHEINLFNLGKKKEEEETNKSTFTSEYENPEPVVDHVELPEDYFYSLDAIEQQALQDAFLEEYFADEKPSVDEEPEADPLAHIIIPEIDRDSDPAHHMAKVMWRAGHPDEDERIHHARHQAGEIDILPWHTAEHINTLALSDRERKQLIDRFATGSPKPATPLNIASLNLQADNIDNIPTGEVKGFGTSFPPNPNKRDMFLRVDQLPSVLYRFNGTNWIEIDKESTDQHAYDSAYIDHLIEKISTGEYDPDLLSNAERDSIEQRLKINPRQV